MCIGLSCSVHIATAGTPCWIWKRRKAPDRRYLTETTGLSLLNFSHIEYSLQNKKRRTLYKELASLVSTNGYGLFETTQGIVRSYLKNVFCPNLCLVSTPRNTWVCVSKIPLTGRDEPLPRLFIPLGFSGGPWTKILLLRYLLSLLAVQRYDPVIQVFEKWLKSFTFFQSHL